MENDWKDPVWGSSIRVALGKPCSGWVQLAILVAARQQHVVISCSDVFNPFGALKHFLMQVATGNLPASFTIDEEGTEATLWTFASAQGTGLIEFFVTESNLMSQDECRQSARLKCRVSRQEFLHAFHREVSQWLKRDYEVDEFGGRYLDEHGRPECDLRQLWFGHPSQFYSYGVRPMKQYRIETIGPMTTVYLGSPGTGDMPASYRQKAIEICVKHFESFTLDESQGYFQGKLETCLLFHIACPYPSKVELFASQLAIELKQEGVGLVQGSDPGLGSQIYKRVIPVRLD